MRFVYPAVIKKQENGTYRADFPDLATCYAEGDTVDECTRNATLAAYDWIDLEMKEDEPDLPPATQVEDIALEDGEIARNILVIYKILEGWEE
ncbi:MAG: type II toxin-antitoxin system HicB family antitoxin [Lachnospiraceae bacterium]|nr:type II toxin-antitoxin system HicB family antitoxin [Lachnospiraceae bacterium]